MTIADQDKLSDAREGLERPPVPRMPRASLRVMLKTSPWIRRLLPTRLVAARAERKGRRLWEHEPTRAHARRTMAALVAGTPREPELEQIARRYVVETQVWEALYWQPWPLPIVDARSRERLIETCLGERGVLLSSCHIGPYFRKSIALFELGVVPYVVAADFWFEEPTKDYWGRRLARWHQGVPSIPVMRPRGSYKRLASLLAAGETVLVYYDMPGPHATRFLGKQAMLADGSARLAVESDALVLPLLSGRIRHRIVLEAGEPIDPRSLAGVDELHDELARAHERWILRQPEAMADPADFGWGDGATASGWRAPAREDGASGGSA